MRLSFPCIYFRGCRNSIILRRITFAFAEKALCMPNVIWMKEYQMFVKLLKVKINHYNPMLSHNLFIKRQLCFQKLKLL